MAVTVYDLAGDGGDSQYQLCTDELLNLGGNGCMCAYGTGDFADGSLLQSGRQTLSMTTQFIYPECKFETKSNWLSVNAMGAGSHQCVLVLDCHLPHCICQLSQ